MDTLTVDEVNAQPQRLVANAMRGESVMVIQNGKPVLMAVPMGFGLEASEVLLEVAVCLFDRDQISVGVAARIAGLSLNDMLKELSKRQIPVVRYSDDDFKDEMKRIDSLTRRG
jgi:predicted HTH domain antitoxin